MIEIKDVTINIENKLGALIKKKRRCCDKSMDQKHQQKMFTTCQHNI